MTPGCGSRGGRPTYGTARPRLPRGAARPRPRTQPGPRRPSEMTSSGVDPRARDSVVADPERDALDLRPTADEMLARVRAETRQDARSTPDLSRHGARRGQDLPDARGRASTDCARHGSRGRLRRDARPAADHSSSWTASSSCPAAGSSTAVSSSRRWTPTPSSRGPRCTLVDELAHTNVPGSVRDKRWQDVEAIRDAGIHVVTTLNVQHLESVADAVATITGAAVNERLPGRSAARRRRDRALST